MCNTMSLTMEDHSDKESPNLSKSMKRSNKPLMEKRRRERINVSLNQLKSLVLDALKKDTSQYSKLEKADILEMTVRHLRTVQRQHLAVAAATDTTVVHKYRAGFTECASEVSRYLSTVDGLGENVRGHIMMHLSNCVQRINTPTSAMHPMQQQQQQQQQQQPLLSPVQSVQPIRIQIPTATQVSTLPGAPVQVRAQQPQQQQQQQQLQALQAQYFGAVQVIPASSFVNVQTVSGTPVVGNVTPLYLSTPSVSPQSSMSSSPPSTCSSPERQLPTPPSTPQPCYPREPTPEKVVPVPMLKAPEHVYAGPVHHYNRRAMEVVNAHNAVKDTLREEKVWRPW